MAFRKRSLRILDLSPSNIPKYLNTDPRLQKVLIKIYVIFSVNSKFKLKKDIVVNLILKIYHQHPSQVVCYQLKVQAQEGYCSQLNIEDIPSTSQSIGVNTNPTNQALELANSKEKMKLLNEQVAELLQIKSAVEKLFTPRQLKRLQNP
ncbi:unnamed protein product [Diabrotica balteata]|uniref:Uncharacterized protein n=1 Tax=Diabrotica balteata TaxID=107213 RepID=A0A9N9T5X4_DIABA|nr:unnamed protein product [Diabrotica balteata]